ncbi:hypothetical protein G5I_14415, partial [Acromyrmex echinatior]
DEVFKAVKPIYEELSSDDLLSRCLGGYTQNNNESFNSVLWSIAPKGVHSSKAIVDIAANIAVCNFNDGLKSVLEIMQVLNLTIVRARHCRLRSLQSATIVYTSKTYATLAASFDGFQSDTEQLIGVIGADRSNLNIRLFLALMK